MIQHLRLPIHFDAARLQQELRQLVDVAWQPHFQVKHYAGDWSALPLRSVGGAVDAGLLSPVEDPTLYKDTDLLRRSPYFREVLGWFACPLMAVRLLKLSPGTRVHAHRDRDLCFEAGLARFHIPVLTHPAIEFLLNGEPMQLAEGECWYMNFNLPHALFNGGSTDRVHLVIDAVVNDWMKAVFADPANPDRKEIADPVAHSSVEQAAIIRELRRMGTEVSNRLADDLERQLTTG